MLNLDQRKMIITVAGSLALISWPAGCLCGSLSTAAMHDAVSAAHGAGIVMLLVVAMINVLAAICLVWASAGVWKQLETRHKALVVVALIPFLLLFGGDRGGLGVGVIDRSYLEPIRKPLLW